MIDEYKAAQSKELAGEPPPGRREESA